MGIIADYYNSQLYIPCLSTFFYHDLSRILLKCSGVLWNLISNMDCFTVFPVYSMHFAAVSIQVGRSCSVYTFILCTDCGNQFISVLSNLQSQVKLEFEHTDCIQYQFFKKYLYMACFQRPLHFGFYLYVPCQLTCHLVVTFKSIFDEKIFKGILSHLYTYIVHYFFTTIIICQTVVN